MQQLDYLSAGDHVCLAWETEQEHQALLAQYLADGLRQQEKVIYFTDAHTPEIIVDYLKDSGVDVARCWAAGQISTLDAESVYLRNGYFEAGRMIALLRAETDRAIAEGYAALRVTGEMSWALLGGDSCAQLFDYEWKINTWFPVSRCIGLCQYDCRRFSAGQLGRALTNHPKVIVSAQLYANKHYMSRNRLLEPGSCQEFLTLQDASWR